LIDIVDNTGTLYNISASTHELWKASTYDVGTSALTMAKILAASALSADKGCDETLTCLVPNATFVKLSSNEAALREYDAKVTKAENGFDSIAFHGANGMIEIVPYMFIKQGEFIMFPAKQTYRIGSSDVTAKIDSKSGDVFFHLEASTAVEMRLYAEWTVFCERPGWCVIGRRSDNLALHT
jgi:hypothetical protein